MHQLHLKMSLVPGLSKTIRGWFKITIMERQTLKTRIFKQFRTQATEEIGNKEQDNVAGLISLNFGTTANTRNYWNSLLLFHEESYFN